ncbi:MAG: PilZ domain-containing protein [Leptospira sp.]|nr:PilZ domain-containing protein [Leptospira sp.]
MEKEIIDPEAILKVITALFGKLPATILNSGQEFPVKVIALKNKSLIINTNLKFVSKDRFLSVVHNGTKFIASFLLAGGDGNGIEILSPLKITLTQAKRQGSRVEVSGNHSGLVVTNIINVNDVSKAIGFDDKKVDAVLLTYRSKLSKAFPQSSIFFAGRMDNRLRLMHHYEKAIFIRDRKDKSSANPDYFPFDEYLRIFESSKIPEHFISEISVPIKYKGYIHLGYVQILAEKPLDEDIFQQLHTFATTVSKDIISTGVFQESKDVCPVMDLSMGGVSFIHPASRSFSRSVTMNGTILFDLSLENGTKVTIRGIIKNIRNQETNFRVGCQFYNLLEFDLNLLDEFLNLAKQTEISEPNDTQVIQNSEDKTDLIANEAKVEEKEGGFSAENLEADDDGQ